MVETQLDSILNFLIPVILITVPVIFIWWKFSEPLKKFGYLIKSMFASGTNKTFQTVQSSKEIVYDI